MAQRSRQREVAQLLEAGSTRVREARTELKRRQREKARMARLNAEAEDGGGDDDGDGERRRRRRQARRRWRRSPNRSFGDLHAQESLPSGPLHPGMPTRKRPNLHRPTISARIRGGRRRPASSAETTTGTASGGGSGRRGGGGGRVRIGASGIYMHRSHYAQALCTPACPRENDPIFTDRRSLHEAEAAVCSRGVSAPACNACVKLP